MISIAEKDFLEFVQGVVTDIKFLQAECQRAGHNHAADPAVREKHAKYEALLAEVTERITNSEANESEEQTVDEDVSPAPASSLPEPSESEDEAPPTV